MRLTHLRLVQFRNHRHSDVALGPGVTFFVGGNAQGKSSLLEAVQVAATARSYRARRDDELISFGAEWARVRAETDRTGRSEQIDIAFRREQGIPAGHPTRVIRINGVPTLRGELFGHLYNVLAGPNDTEVVSGGPHLRRRLLDLLLTQVSPSYYNTVQRFARAVLQRNRLLRRRSVRGLEAWDDQVAALGAGLTLHRRQMISRLSRLSVPIYDALCMGREHLEIEYVPSLQGSDEREMATWARAVLLQRQQEELARGMTLVGPHRDDVRIQAGGYDLRTFGSRGQQLTAMLALRLAERQVLREETGEEPVMLLDDILFTLDEERQVYLLDCLRGVQSLVTVTQLGVLKARTEHAVVYHVRGGTVSAEHAHIS